ncbi:alpha/beta hydrolase [Salinibacillus xinjiangensis]|uniref:alpha/beta hydrolase n=1 Tax=Salinibacillus xinjiangensis TaxID=1229268 RepID=UPI002B269DFB|nr:alpha/beta fold hydrolase [Salinibacillus xinjiangensis]
MADENLAHVYTPDLRGHGDYAARRGDIDYLGQHDDDLMELIDKIKSTHGDTKLIMGGHSAGGGTSLRMLTHKYDQYISGYLLLAPFVHFMAPIMKKSKGETESNNKAHMGTMIKLMIFNGFWMKKWNHQTVLSVNHIESDNPSKLNFLSYRLFMSRLPRNYKKSLRSIKKPTLVLVGDKDEEFEHTAYEPLFSKHTQGARVKTIDNATHDGLLSNADSFEAIKEWIADMKEKDI